MLNYKIQGKKIQLAKLKDGLGKCSRIEETKVKACKENLTKKIKKVDDQIECDNLEDKNISKENNFGNRNL